MIYLIDDKKERQNSLGWTPNKIAQYQDVLTPIYSFSEIENHRSAIFNSESIILYHESFFDNPINAHKKSTLELKLDLINHSNNHKTIVVFFSGSIGSRNTENYIASIPANALYKNLEVLLENYKTKNNIDINTIVYGNDYKSEKILNLKREIWDLLFLNSDEEEFILNEEIDALLNELTKITAKKILVDGITNGYFKFQINTYPS